MLKFTDILFLLPVVWFVLYGLTSVNNKMVYDFHKRYLSPNGKDWFNYFLVYSIVVNWVYTLYIIVGF